MVWLYLLLLLRALVCVWVWLGGREEDLVWLPVVWVE